MGTKHGISESWMQFVVEYLQYAASKWTTAGECKKWINNYFNAIKRLILQPRASASHSAQCATAARAPGLQSKR